MKLFVIFLCYSALSLVADSVYVTAFPATTGVSVIDTDDNMVSATILVGDRGLDAAYLPTGQRVYIPSYNTGLNRVYAINASDNSTAATISTGTDPISLVATPDGLFVYVANFASSNVSIIDTTSNMVPFTVPVTASPLHPAANPDGTNVYVIHAGSSTISIINTTSHAVTTTSPVTTPSHIKFSPTGDVLYIANNTGSIFVVDPASNTVVNTITPGASPLSYIFPNADGSKLYVSGYPGNNFYVLDVASETFDATLTLTQPRGMAFNPDESQVYVGAQIGTLVSYVNTASNTLGGTITVGTGPIGIGSFNHYCTWRLDSSASWNTAANWNPQIIPSNGNFFYGDMKVQFLDVLTAPRSVSVSSDVTVGGMIFRSSQPYTIATSGGDIILDGTPVIDVSVHSAAHIISADISLLADLTISKTVAADFTISGGISGGGGGDDFRLWERKTL